MCRCLVHQTRHADAYETAIPGELSACIAAESPRNFFGLHVGEAHPSAIVPDLATATCGSCRSMEIYLAVEGPGIEYPDITGYVSDPTSRRA